MDEMKSDVNYRFSALSGILRLLLRTRPQNPYSMSLHNLSHLESCYLALPNSLPTSSVCSVLSVVQSFSLHRIYFQRNSSMPPHVSKPTPIRTVLLLLGVSTN